MITIHLDGPQGNVFYILAVAEKIAVKHGIADFESIEREMKSSDYTNALDVFRKYFSEYAELI